MRSISRLFSLLLVTTFTLTAVTGCHRNHSANGMRSVGKHPESRQISSDEEFGWTYDQDSYSASGALDAATSQGANYLNPGESGIPSYERFAMAPSELARYFQTLYFGTNDDVIRGKENFAKVAETAQYLKAHPSVLIFIEGHCDERGAAAYNLSLGARRANSVRNLLIEQGVDASRIFTITFGKERPARGGHSEEAWRWNRRCEYKIVERK